MLRPGVIIGRNVRDTPVARNAGRGAFEPLLAAAWSRADDTTLHLSLREGVTFHDGSGFDANDVVAMLGYVAEPANGIVSQQVASWIASVERTGPLSVRIKAKAPTPAAME